MFGPACRHAVGKLGQTGLARPVDVFHLHPAGWTIIILEQQVDARILAIFHLPSQPRIPGQFGQGSRENGFLSQGVGLGGQGADQLPVGLHNLPGVFQLALGIIRGGQPDPEAGILDARHGSGIGAMCGHNRAIRQFGVGEKALVTLDQPGLDQFRREFHVLDTLPDFRYHPHITDQGVGITVWQA